MGSDEAQVVRISAREARRSFSKLLDKIEAGCRFVVHRHGRDACVIAPALVRGRRATECLKLLQGHAPVLLDDLFERDMLDVLAAEPVEERPPWGS